MDELEKAIKDLEEAIDLEVARKKASKGLKSVRDYYEKKEELENL